MINGVELLDTTRDQSGTHNQTEVARIGAMELELAAALSVLRAHSFVESVQVSPDATAEVKLQAANLNAMTLQRLIDACAQRGFHIQVNADYQVVLAPPLTMTRTELMTIGRVLSESLKLIGSESSAPEPATSSQSLSAHDRELLANVPPHHGE